MARIALTAASALILLLPRAARADDGPVVRPTLVAQLRLSAEFPQANGAVVPPATLELRRVRPGLRLSAMGGRLSGIFVLNTSPSALELMDLWLEYQPRAHVRVRVGQTKQPFTAYRLGNFTDLHFTDWALVTRTFGGERQLGVEVHNRGEGGAWEYSVGLWNGVTQRAAHGRGDAVAWTRASRRRRGGARARRRRGPAPARGARERQRRPVLAAHNHRGRAQRRAARARAGPARVAVTRVAR